MRLTLSAMSLPALALGAFMMQATPVFAQAAAPTTGPTNPPATSAPVTTPSPPANGLPSTPPSAAAPSMSTPSTGSTKKASHRMSMDARFKAANTTNDGNLTLDQAKAANWSYVTKNFSAIDKGSKGYVTMADIHSFAKARRAAHHHSTTTGGTTGAANPPAALNPPPMSPQ